jgi:hypothetical protein
MVVFTFFTASLLKIIAVLIIIKKAPNNVEYDTTSSKIKIPEIIAKIRLRYFIGVTKETSALRIDIVNKILPIDPKIPIANK